MLEVGLRSTLADGMFKQLESTYLRSTYLMWLILFSIPRFRVSSWFPAMASLSKAVSFSQTTGTSLKLLKESPREQSCCRFPNSSGKDVRKFPSRHKVWRLWQAKGKRETFRDAELSHLFNIVSEFIHWLITA